MNPSVAVGIPREGIYIGELSRSLHEHALEHVKDAQAFSVKSQITKHWMNSHPSLPSPPKMEFSISSRFRDCLSRQIGEALKINFSIDVLLNSKAEYLSNSVSRLTVKEDAWEMKERTRKEEEQEEIDKVRVEEFKRLITANCVPATHETVTIPVTEPCQIVRINAKQNLLSQDTEQNVITASLDINKEQDPDMAIVEGGSSLTTLTGTMCNTVYVNTQEQDINLASMEGGSSVTTLTGTKCNIVYETDEEEFNSTVETTETIMYKTDEEEFSSARSRSTDQIENPPISVTAHLPAVGPPKNRKTAKRKMVATAQKPVKPKKGPGDPRVSLRVPQSMVEQNGA